MSQEYSRKIRAVFFALLIILPMFGLCREKEWRDVLGKQGLSENDEKNLRILDRIIVSKSGSESDFEEVVRVIRETDSLSVVCQALVTISNFSNVSESILAVLNDLSKEKNGRILLQVSLVYGKLARFRTFPSFFALRMRPYPGLSDNIVALLHRFGIEAMAGLPLMLPKLHLANGRRNPASFYLNFFFKIPQHCLTLTCIGIGVPIPFVPPQLPIDLFSELEPKPALPAIKRMLDELKNNTIPPGGH